MGLTVYGGGGKPEEEKTVTAGTSAIVVSPSSGKAMKKVTVNPTPTESKSVTPTTEELTVTPSEGKHLSQVVVGAVEDVTPEVTAQTPVITQIAENLGVTITTPSGTNKQVLQGNNENLQSIKTNAKKEGLYAWKKSEYDIITFTQLTTGTTITIKVESTTTDLSKVNASFFKGVKGTYAVGGSAYPFEFITDSQISLSGSNAAFTYNPSTNVISIVTQISVICVWNVDTVTRFIANVVSDNAAEYPNNGEQDGLWYEALNAGFDYGTVTPTGYATDIKVAHNLKKIPSRSGIMKTTNAIYQQNTSCCYGGTVTENEITFTATSYSFINNVPYFWFVFA